MICLQIYIVLLWRLPVCAILMMTCARLEVFYVSIIARFFMVPFFLTTPNLPREEGCLDGISTPFRLMLQPHFELSLCARSTLNSMSECFSRQRQLPREHLTTTRRSNIIYIHFEHTGDAIASQESHFQQLLVL